MIVVTAALSITCRWRLSMPIMVAGLVVITQFAASSVLRIAVVSRLRELKKTCVIGNTKLASFWKGSLNEASLADLGRCYGGASHPLDFGERTLVR